MQNLDQVYAEHASYRNGIIIGVGSDVFVPSGRKVLCVGEWKDDECKNLLLKHKGKQGIFIRQDPALFFGTFTGEIALVYIDSGSASLLDAFKGKMIRGGVICGNGIGPKTLECKQLKDHWYCIWDGVETSRVTWML